MHDLQIIYKKQADKFVKPLSYFNKLYAIRRKPEEAQDDKSEHSEEQEVEDSEAPVPKKTNSNQIDLLDLDLIEKTTNELTVPPVENKPVYEMDDFSEMFEYDDEEFQSKWGDMKCELVY